MACEKERRDVISINFKNIGKEGYDFFSGTKSFQHVFISWGRTDITYFYTKSLLVLLFLHLSHHTCLQKNKFICNFIMYLMRAQNLDSLKLFHSREATTGIWKTRQKTLQNNT